jgi:hypothetical protein
VWLGIGVLQEVFLGKFGGDFNLPFLLWVGAFEINRSRQSPSVTAL